MTEQTQPGVEAPEQEPIANEPPQTGADPGDENDFSEHGQPREPTRTETEKLAIQMGWSPPEKWRGPPEQHRSADEFILKTNEINRKTREDLARERQEFAQRIERMERVNQVALQRQREELWNRWEAAKENAASMGDIDQYRRLNQGQGQALNDFDERIAPALQPPQQQQPEVPAEVYDFAVRNQDWYQVDDEMSGYAVGALTKVSKQFPNMPLAKQLEVVEQRVKQAFPARFPQAPQRSEGPSAPGVEGGLRAIRTTRGKGWNDLPPEAKQAFSNQKDIWKEKDGKTAAQRYADAYWNQE